MKKKTREMSAKKSVPHEATSGSKVEALKEGSMVEALIEENRRARREILREARPSGPLGLIGLKTAT